MSTYEELFHKRQQLMDKRTEVIASLECNEQVRKRLTRLLEEIDKELGIKPENEEPV